MTFNKFSTGLPLACLPFACLLLLPMSALAGGPRWYTGPPFYTASEGQPVVFFTPDVLYYTDPGDLNASVSHAQADAMVAAAAAVWQVPTARLTLAQGGTLAEHVSSSNTYFDGNQVVWPDDVQLANYRAKPIAVVYDTDGSVIDTLLGSGASLPAACRQNGVVESVDGLDPDGTIHHALLILNGRCVGSTADQLTQMRYQLTRAFGRVIGLAWSQLNDNVFTGTPTPTLAQALNWPLMHPIDVICGPYTYKCMVQPFTLRPDDLCALAQLYPVTATNVIAGKTLSAVGGTFVFGKLLFPTGQGMDAVNVVVTRQSVGNALEAAQMVSAVSGMGFQQYAGNPVTGAPSGAAESNGKSFPDAANTFIMQRIPLPDGLGYTLFYSTESINPLYTGTYAIGPYVGQPTSMSGPTFPFIADYVLAGGYNVMVETLTQAATSCNPGSDGTEDAPAVSDGSGFWNGLLCGPRHTSWWSQNVKAGRTWTAEVTAVDENGVVSTSKAHPLLGVWNATDARGTTPTLARTQSAFNAQTLGMTQLKMDAASAAASVRIAVADERGHGRPDFGYKMRVLYADTIAPTQVGASGGRVTITGQGFRTGNRVTVNGVAAVVVSWTANTIVATAPTKSASHVTGSGSVDVAVIDASTGGSTVMQAALSYAAIGANTITLVSAPAQAETGAVAGTPLAVRVMSADGVTPVSGASVRFAVTAGAATFAACGLATCTLTTDASGSAQSALTASATGAVMLVATEVSGGAQVQASVTVSDPVRLIAVVSAPAQAETGIASTAPLIVRVTRADGTTPVAGAGVRFAVTAGTATFAACGAASCLIATDASGYVRSTFTASVTGTLALSATEVSGGAMVRTSVTVSDPVRLVALVSAPAQMVTGNVSSGAFTVKVTTADGVTPVPNARVRFAVLSGTATFTACAAASCLLTTDVDGRAQSVLTATVAGTLVLAATELSGGATVQASVTVSDPARLILLVSAPSRVEAGTASAIPLAVRVAAGDGVTPIAGASVHVVVTAGTATFSVCPATTCTLTTDADGLAQTGFTAGAAGTLVLSATESNGGASLRASVAVSDPVRLIAVVSAPARMESGAVSTTPFAVRVTAADGVTPIAGASVRVAATAGIAVFAACGAATCILTTDANGLAQTAFTAGAAGTLVLSATELKGGANVQASITVSDPVRLIALVGAPAQMETGVASTTAFAARVTAADGVTPVPGAQVRLAALAGSATFAACGSVTCVATSDAGGYVRSTVTASVAGTVVLSATEVGGGATVQASANVTDPVRIITLVLTPAQLETGAASATAFAVRVTAVDGVTPVAGASVQFVVSAGSAAFAACGAAVCTLTTDAAGYARSTVTASVSGMLALKATELKSGLSVQASATVSDAVRLLLLVWAPPRVETGVASATPFAVRVTAADGVTPVAGASVRLAAVAGAAVFAACGAAACIVTTDADGYARSALIAGAAGTLSLMATELKGGAAVLANVTVSDPVRVVALAGAARYLAAGAPAQWTLSLSAGQDGALAAGLPVAWSAGPGLFLGAVSSVTDGTGAAHVSVLTTGLAAGAEVAVQGCAWSSVCATSSVYGVAESEWTLTAATGANQSVSAAGTLSAVQIRVTDASGHALEGAKVAVYQTVSTWEGPCPASGRCAAAPVLASSQSNATSDADGNVTITPLEVPGVASVVHIAAVTGTQGFVTLALTKAPL